MADLMKSVSIVEYTRGEHGMADSLTEVARHFQTAWGTAVAHVAEDTFLESEAEGNLMVLHQNRNGVTEDDRRRLETTSEMRLGEMVNRIRSINVPVSPEAAVIPRAFLATVRSGLGFNRRSTADKKSRSKVPFICLRSSRRRNRIF